MIEARFEKAFEALERSLAERAKALSRARAARLLMERRRSARHWRKADLLWPLFAKG